MDFGMNFDQMLRFGMCLHRFDNCLQMCCFSWSCNGCPGCSPYTIPFLLLSVAHNFGVVFVIGLGIIFASFQESFW